MAEPKRADKRMSAQLADPIADLRPASKFLRVLDAMRKDTEQTERNV